MEALVAAKVLTEDDVLELCVEEIREEVEIRWIEAKDRSKPKLTVIVPGSLTEVE